MLVVFDIDMTIANGTRRALAAGPEPDRAKDPARYEAWKNAINAGVEHDMPIPGMLELVTAMADYNAVYLTARGSDLRSQTRDWLKANGFPDLMLFMRAQSDFRSSAKFKEYVIQKLIVAEHESVIVVDDDERGELAKVCKLRGWTMLKAGV
jgi:hypothetical protein